MNGFTRKIFAFVSLARPANFLLVFAAVLIGGALSGTIGIHSLVAAFSAALVLSGANAANDYFDINADSISHPERVLPKGMLTRHEAMIFAIVAKIAGLILAFTIGPRMAIFAFWAIALLWGYSLWLSGTPLVGNFVISVLCGSALIYGALPSGVVSAKTVWAAIIAAAINFPREILKDVSDIEGDRKAGRATFPNKFGIRKAVNVAVICAIFAQMVILIPYAVGIYSQSYLAAAFFASMMMWFGIIYAVRGYPEQGQRFLKVAMVLGVLALAIEVIFGGK